MDEQGESAEGVIHFICEHCQISLTVDDSLAGVTGPCPSCGEAITAPRPDSEEPRKVTVRPRDLKSRADSSVRPKGADVQASSRKVAGSKSGSSHRRRSVSPETGVSEAHRERAEVAAVAKMLVAGLIVLAVVLAVAYWLKHNFNA